MPARDRQPQFERCPSGLAPVNRENMLAALSTVLPPETMAKLRAGLERLDAARQQEAPSDERDIRVD